MSKQDEFIIKTAATATMVAKMVSDVSDNFNSAYSGHEGALKIVSENLHKMSLMGQFLNERPELAGEEVNVVMGEVIKTYNEPNLNPVDKSEILSRIKKSITQYSMKCLAVASKINLDGGSIENKAMSI